MPALVLVVIGFAAFFLGYRFYSRFIAEKIYRLDPDFETPAHEMEDGIDYVPTNRHVLWGHHFTSVAGAAPIVGPAIAVIWGWLPAFLWVVLGTVFFAGVHDFGALWASVRHKAKSMGALAEEIIGVRARSLFMIVMFLLILMVNAVFAVVISNLFVAFPGSVLPIWIEVAIALVIGYVLYRRGMGIFWPSLIALLTMYAFVVIGYYVPIELPATVMGLSPGPQWIILLFVYAFIASLLPVWTLLQPRDYINALQLFVGLGILYLGILFLNPSVVAPAFNTNVPADAPPLVPLLFVTIACGAISGFHGLVSSGTTSKQLDKETDGRWVGYLGAVGEGALALVAILAATAGFATFAEWEGFYASYAGVDGVGAFVQGGANLAAGLGIPVEFGQILIAVLVVSFAATTMDTGVRLQRYIIQEWGNIYNVPVLTNRFWATFIAVGSCVALAFGAGGTAGTGGYTIWPLFGTSNQLLAGLTLLVVSVYLARLGRPTVYTMAPLVFILVMTTYAMVLQLGDFMNQGNYFLAAVGALVLGAALWIVLEAISVFQRLRREPAALRLDA